MKIVFIDSIVAEYRIPFFQKLSELYDVEFLFTHEEKIKVFKHMKSEIITSHLEIALKKALKILKRPYSPYTHFGIAFGLVPKLLRKEFDVIIAGDTSSVPAIVETFISLIIAKMRHKPFILYYGGWRKLSRKDLKRRLIELLINYIVRHSQAIVTYGTRSKNYLTLLGARKNQIFIAPNSSLVIRSMDQNEMAILRKRLAIQDKRIILFVGRLTKNKNPHLLIVAFYKLVKDMKNVKLIMIGDGELESELMKLSKVLGIEDDVLFLGRIKREDLPLYYALCDVFVLPSSNETWGLVLNEAMSYSKPVIASTGVGAVDDLIKDGINGFVVPEGDAYALYQAIKRVLSNSQLERRMGIESKRIIYESFTYEHMVYGFKMAIDYVVDRGDIALIRKRRYM